jgi:hypothetical protein
MVRALDVGKRMAWSQRFRRFDQWTGTVARFCANERVSVASFYHWRRKLASNGTQKSHADFPCTSTADSRSNAKGQRDRKRADRNSPQTDQAFVPVQVVGSAVVEVFLAEGARLSIPVDATSALQTVVRALCVNTGLASEGQDSGEHAC